MTVVELSVSSHIARDRERLVISFPQPVIHLSEDEVPFTLAESIF
jgi:hypothetical protein